MYTADQQKQIAKLIQIKLQDPQIHSVIAAKLKQMNLTESQMTEDVLQEILEETGILNQIFQEQHIAPEGQTQNINNAVKTNNKSIQIKILTGKAFNDFIDSRTSDGSFLQVYVAFGRQRYSTKPVQASVTPTFNETFLFDLKSDTIDAMTLLKLDQQIEMQIVLITANKQRVMYSIKHIEWRFILTHGALNLNLDMKEYYTRQKIGDNKQSTSGILMISLEWLPRANIQLIDEKILVDQLSKEKKLKEQFALTFHQYSQEYWNDYKSIQKGFEKRVIKVYSQNEDLVHKPVCTFLRQIHNAIGIPSPNHAARFVALIPYQKNEKFNGQRQEVWSSFYSFLAVGYGDFEDHCLLLCSFFLGFGLDAYCVLGTETDGVHGWVITRNNSKNDVWFWESLTGQKLNQKDPKVSAIYKKIGCCFNHKSFYANIQLNDGAQATDFNFEDPQKWKAIEPAELVNLKPSNPELGLLKSDIDQHELEENLEKELKDMIRAYRQAELKLTTRFDEALASVLQISLINYEHEQVTGTSFSQTEFQEGLKNSIPNQHSFKAFPFQQRDANVKKMLTAITSSPIGKEVVSSKGDSVFLGLRIRIELFPENFFAVWVILAARFHNIQ